MQYERDNDIRFEKVLLPNGSSGTHAGLAAGFVTRGRSPTIIRSYTVLGDQEQAVQQTLKLANDALALVGSSEIAPNQIDVDGNHRGEGYGIPTAEALEAIASLAQAEGILLDPVYSAKAFAGMLHDIAAGDFIEGLTYCSCTQAADRCLCLSQRIRLLKPDSTGICSSPECAGDEHSVNQWPAL